MRIKMLKVSARPERVLSMGQIVEVSDEEGAALVADHAAESLDAPTKPEGGAGQGGGRKKVVEVVELIAKAETLEDLDAIVEGDDRATVVKAAEARRAELNA